MPACAYHPDRVPVDRCQECYRDICSECRTVVAGKPVCSTCVAAIRARVASELSTAPNVASAPQPYQPTASYVPVQPVQTQPAAASGSTYGMPSPIVQETPGPGRLLAGIALGAIFGIIGAYVLKMVAYYGHIEIGYLNILVGSAAGFGVVIGSGRQGILQGILGGLLALGSMLLSDYLLLQQKFQELTGTSDPVPFDIFTEMLKHQNPMHWLIVAIGVYAGFGIGMKKNR